MNIHRLWSVAREEFNSIRPRLLLIQILLALLPSNAGARIRAFALKMIGFRLGRGSIFSSMPRISGDGDIYGRLKIGDTFYSNVGFTLELGNNIIIGNNVTIGQEVMILTTTHHMGNCDHRGGERKRLPVHIEDGVWIGARCTILPGVTVGKGAVVGAGSIVNKDVSPNTVVAGVPARVVKKLDESLDLSAVRSPEI